MSSTTKCQHLTESLSRKYSRSRNLIPEGGSAVYGRFEQACSVEQSYFAAAAEAIGTELYIKPYAHQLRLHVASYMSIVKQ